MNETVRYLIRNNISTLRHSFDRNALEDDFENTHKNTNNILKSDKLMDNLKKYKPEYDIPKIRSIVNEMKEFNTHLINKNYFKQRTSNFSSVHSLFEENKRILQQFIKFHNQNSTENNKLRLIPFYDLNYKKMTTQLDRMLIKNREDVDILNFKILFHENKRKIKNHPYFNNDSDEKYIDVMTDYINNADNDSIDIYLIALHNFIELKHNGVISKCDECENLKIWLKLYKEVNDKNKIDNIKYVEKKYNDIKNNEQIECTLVIDD